jgi:hypothetical protein
MFLSLFAGLIAICQSQTITVLSKDEIFKSPNKDMVVMDKFTFGKYHYTAEKYDTLKSEIIELDSIVQAQENSRIELVKDYEYALQTKDLETNVLKEGYKNVKDELSTSIEKGNQLILDYKVLEGKRNKTKRWRNFFMGTTAISAGVLILLIAL